jgi:hypothetical protein
MLILLSGLRSPKVAFVHSFFPREVELHNSHVYHGPVSLPLVLSSCAVSYSVELDGLGGLEWIL